MLKTLKISLIAFTSFSLYACSVNSPNDTSSMSNQENSLTTQITDKQDLALKPLISKPINKSAKVAYARQRVLDVGKKMVNKHEIGRGSCWDYIDTVYSRAGYPISKRAVTFKSKKSKGPYAKTSQIQPGDWIYFINHSYHNSEHSGIFIHWVDRSKRIARVLSYPGGNKKKPAVIATINFQVFIM